MALAKRRTLYLVRQRTLYWDGRMNGYMNILQTMANIMNFYENLPVNERRCTEENIRNAMEEQGEGSKQVLSS